MVLETLIFQLFRAWYTFYVVLILGLQFWRKGPKLFEKKPRTKPDCLNGWNSQYLKLTKVRLHYVQTGDNSKPLMLFVHGYPEFWYSWRFQLKEFENDYRCVAIDQRGYNLSDKPYGLKNYKVDELVNDLKEVIETLGYKKAIVVAHDWGGIVGWTLCEKYPEMVEKFVALNIPRPSAFRYFLKNSWTQFRKSWYIFFYQTPKIPELLCVQNDMEFLNLAFRSSKMGIRNAANFTDDDLEAWKYVFSHNGASFRYPINYYRSAFSSSSTARSSVDVELKMPILIIWGTADGALEKRLAELSLKNVADGRIEWIDGASHWVQQDEPEKVNKLIRQFI